MAHNLLATTKNLGVFKGLGNLGGQNLMLTDKDTAFLTFGKTLSLIVGVLTIVGFIWFIFVLFSGAVSWLSSAGDKTKLQEAQKHITTGLTGLLIVVFAIFLIKIMETILGINILGIYDLLNSL